MIILPVILESLRSLKDRTYKLVFDTQELTPEQLGELGINLQSFGYLAFKNEPFTTDEAEAVESLKADYDDTGKSPGQRLRGVFFRLWEQDPEGYDDFNLYYKFKMEKVINHYKKMLD